MSVSARLPLAVVAWTGAVVAAIALSGAVAGSIHPTGASAASASSSSFGSASSGSSADPSSVRAADPGSLMRTGNLTQALSTLRGHLGADARLANFVLYPGYVSATAVHGASEIDATDYVNGTYTQTSTSGFPGSDPLLPLGTIDPRVPGVFAGRLARVAHVPLGQVRYMIATLDPITHKFSWSAYLAPGSRFEYLSAPGGTGPIHAYTPGGSLRTLRG